MFRHHCLSELEDHHTRLAAKTRPDQFTLLASFRTTLYLFVRDRSFLNPPISRTRSQSHNT
jgi:hypothetical protein